MIRESTGRIAVWAGRFARKSAFEKYFRETFDAFEDDADSPISEFAAEAKTGFYDHDFLVAEFLPRGGKPVAEAFDGFPHVDAFLNRAAKKAENAGLEKVNAVVVFRDAELTPPRWPAESPLTFLGNYGYQQRKSKASRSSARRKKEAGRPPGTGTDVGLTARLSDRITALAFSADGKRLLGASGKGDLAVWDANSGELAAGPFKKVLGGSPVDAIRSTSVEDRYVVSSLTHSRIWDDVSAAPAGKRVETMEFALTPDGSRALKHSLGFGSGRVIDLVTGKAIGQFPKEISLSGMRTLPDGRVLTMDDEGGKLRIWDLDDCRCVAEADADEELSKLELSPSGRTAVCHMFNSDRFLAVRIPELTPLKPVKVKDHISDLAVPGDKDVVLLNMAWRPQRFSLETGKPIPIKGVPKGEYGSLRVDPSGRLVTGVRDGKFVDVFSMSSGSRMASVGDEIAAPVKSEPTETAFDRAGKRMAVGFEDGTVFWFPLPEQVR